MPCFDSWGRVASWATAIVLHGIYFLKRVGRSNSRTVMRETGVRGARRAEDHARTLGPLASTMGQDNEPNGMSAGLTNTENTSSRAAHVVAVEDPEICSSYADIRPRDPGAHGHEGSHNNDAPEDLGRSDYCWYPPATIKGLRHSFGFIPAQQVSRVRCHFDRRR